MGPHGRRVRSAGLVIRKPRVQVPLWPLAGFVHGSPEFKSSATLVKSRLVCLTRPVGILKNNNMFYLNFFIGSLSLKSPVRGVDNFFYYYHYSWKKVGENKNTEVSFFFLSSSIDLERFLHWPRAFSRLTRARVSLEHTWAEKYTKKPSAPQAICWVLPYVPGLSFFFNKITATFFAVKCWEATFRLKMRENPRKTNRICFYSLL